MRRLSLLVLLAGCVPADDGDENPMQGADVLHVEGERDAASGAQDPNDAGEPEADGAQATPDMADPDAAPLQMVEIGLEVGQQAPDFTLPDHDGIDVTLSDYRGRDVLVFGSSVW